MALTITLCSLLVAIGAAVVSVPKIYRAAITCASFFVRLNRAIPILDHIASEVRPNGGSSLKDRVNKAAADSAKAVEQNQYIMDSLDNGTKQAQEAMRIAIEAAKKVEGCLIEIGKISTQVKDLTEIESRKT